jgi:hypothetical protein
MRIRMFGLLLLPIALPVALVQPAQSRIVCDGVFQVVNGQPIATPYCEDHNLARVARSYGMRVSFSSIRSSESVKAGVCRTIGHDNRVREVCLPYRNDGGNQRFRF